MRTPQKLEPHATAEGPKTIVFILALALFILGAAQPALAQSTNVSSGGVIDISTNRGSETDPAVVINPNNATNVFVAAVSSVTNGLFITWTSNYNTNGTSLWSGSVIATIGTNSSAPPPGASNYSSPLGSTYLVPAYGEPSVAWDVNSNLFIAYEPADFQGVGIAFSTNGGRTFYALTNLATNDVTDQPRIVAGLGTTTNGSNCANVWVVYKDYSVTSNGVSTPLMAVGLQTTNVGTNGIGSFGAPFVLPGSGAGGFPDITTGPSNEVMVAYQNNITSSSTAKVFVNVNTNSLLTNGFGSAVTVTSDATGGFTYIPAEESDEGVNAGVGVVWDQNPGSAFYGRSYVVYSTAGNNAGLNMNIGTRYSVNGGASWSAETLANDDSKTDNYSHFLPRIAIDYVTGSVALCWDDCRNDTGPSSTQVILIMNSQVTNYYTNTFDQDGLTNDDFMVYCTVSLNGGTSYTANFSAIPIWNTTTLTANPPTTTKFTYTSEAALANNVNGLGHHIGLAYSYGDACPVWPDNSVFVNGNPPPAGGFDLYAATVVLQTAALAVTATESPYPPTVNQSLNYYVIATNYGPFTATGIKITNVLPANVTYVSATVGSNGTISLPSAGVVVFNIPNLVYSGHPVSVTNLIRVTATFSGIATNIATISSTLPTTATLNLVTNYSTNNTWVSSSASGIVTNIVQIGVQDLAVGLSVVPTNAPFGAPVTATITVTNLGSQANAAVFVTNGLSANLTQISNVMPPGTTYTVSGTNVIFNLGTIPTNQPATVSYTAIPVSIAGATNATISVYATSSDFDPNLTNNYTNITISLLGEDVGVGLVASTGDANIGDIITYTEYITNYGPATDAVVSITNLFSDNLTNITIVQYPPYTNFTEGGQTTNSLYFGLGQMVSNQVITIVFTATAKSVSPTDTNGIVTASVSSTDYDPNLTNNTASTLTIVNAVMATASAFTNLTVTPFATSAFINWSAPLAATAQVAYGLTTNYTSSTAWSSPTVNPVFLLTGLSPDSTYYFQITSIEGGNYYSTNGSFSTVDTLILNTYDAYYSGTWLEGSPSLSGIYGPYFNDAQTVQTIPTASATYAPKIPTPGYYTVSMWYPISTNFTTNATVDVFGGTNAVLDTVNQTSNGGNWFILATNLYFAGGTNGAVVVYNNTGKTNQIVAANAMKWSYLTNQDFAGVPSWWTSFWTNYLATHAGNPGVVMQPVQIQQSGAQVVLSWPFGLLYRATNVSGPWTVVPGATPPYTNTPSGFQTYFSIITTP